MRRDFFPSSRDTLQRGFRIFDIRTKIIPAVAEVQKEGLKSEEARKGICTEGRKIGKKRCLARGPNEKLLRGIG